MRALAHPTRLALLMALGDGPKTATECAAIVGESPSSCSFHLRSLAHHGLIEEAEARNGRERPWRKRKGGLRWEVRGRPELVPAASALRRTFLENDMRRVAEYAEVEPSLPPEWQDALYTQSTLFLTAAELEELGERIGDLLDEYIPRNRRNAPEGARRVHFAAVGVPYVKP